MLSSTRPSSAHLHLARLKNPERVPPCRRAGKTLLWLLGAAALFGVAVIGCCGVFGFMANKAAQDQQAALAEADKLYPSDPGAAAKRYKDGYPAAGNRKAEVLARIGDYEATKGDKTEAQKWVQRAVSEGVTPAYTSPPARDLYAQAQREKAEKDAKDKADREAKVKDKGNQQATQDSVRANRELPRDEFRAMLAGKSQQQVLDLIGKPNETQDAQGIGTIWYYSNVSSDPVTKKRFGVVQVVFGEGGGVAETINFN